MKLKTRLTVAFCIVILLPLGLGILIFLGLYRIQLRSIAQTYGIELSDPFGVWSSSLQSANRYTKSDYEELKELSAKDPALLEDQAYLEEENARLGEKNSFLIFCRNGEIAYNGYEGISSLDDEYWEDALPAYGETGSDVEAGYYIDGETQCMLRQIDFLCGDGAEGSIYIITSSESIYSDVRDGIISMIVCLVFILGLTAGVMTFWIYRGTITPVKKLRTAMNKIKEGDLDFTIEYEGEDEMAQLCQSFEEMRRRLKESTEEKVRGESENRELISNIAHDLKTPVTTVKGYAEGIVDGVANTPEKLDHYIRTIYKKSNEIDRLLNELTFYSQIDTNRIPYNFKKLNAAEYFDDCIEEIGMDLETREVGISYINYAERNVTIIADPEQLMRVINNIVSNAVKYMERQNGQIRICLKDVGDFVQVEIADNGKGIAAKDLPYIFDRFYRTDSSRNSATGGSGIGLSIAKKIIEDHGGQIWATSREENGTTVYFVIRKYQEVPSE